ncbi:response regulator [Taibaiella koreensis]|uniref:response regulator n=1 Tax=Taibaiella koreensis TaxID=1268548 RepID=UPI000E599363|nr:response regulator transcription factor [Taibaiella koreensis]
MRIIIADDHNIIRYGTRMLIQDAIPNAVISECADFDSLIALLKKDKADLLLCDVKMPGGNNFKIIEVIHFYNPDIRILIFSALKEENYALRYLSVGANGYIQKDRNEQELLTAIREVMQKGRYLSSKLSDLLVDDALSLKKGSSVNPLNQLSHRELEIANLLLQGMNLSQIAATLHIQLSTVSTYKSRLYDKLKVTQLVDLMQVFSQYNEGAD